MEHNEEKDGNHLVRVRAQVMMRDEEGGGWVPLGGGGLSHVAVKKRKVHHEDDPPCKHEYLIYGKRINDQKVVMSCTIKKDFTYNIVMPTFHHWKTGNFKYGLTFLTAADARAFDKGVQIALQDLLAEHTVACPHQHSVFFPLSNGLTSPSTTTSPLQQLNRDVEDEEPFMHLELPLRMERESGSGSGSPPGSPGPLGRGPGPPYPSLHRSRTITGVAPRLRGPLLPAGEPQPLGDNIYEWLRTCGQPSDPGVGPGRGPSLTDKLEKLKEGAKDW